MLSGQAPFRGQTAFEVALHHVRTEPPPLAAARPDLPGELCAIVHKMMAKKPEERYQGCRELLADLARVREGLNNHQAGGVVTQPLAASGPLPLAASDSGPQTDEPAQLTGRVLGASTAAAVTRRPRRRLTWAVVGSIILAAVGGGAVGWLHQHAGARSVAPVGTEVADPRPLPTEAEREKFLQTAVQRYLDPGAARPEDTARQVRLGLDHAVELALFYLDRWKLAEADDLFARLTAAGDKVPQYLKLGRLGHAIVLALQDRPAESNKLFMEVCGERGEREKLLQAYWFRQNPKLQVWITRALDHNVANAPNQFPKELRPLQTPSRRGPDKPSGGKP
jgi:serine/threonine-protein kinase